MTQFVPNSLKFETAVDLQILPYLADYQLFGKHILPFTALLEIGLAAASDLYKSGGYDLSKICSQKHLVLSEECGQSIETCLTSESDARYTFEVRSLVADA